MSFVKGEIHTSFHISILTISSLLCFPPPTSSSGEDKSFTKSKLEVVFFGAEVFFVTSYTFSMPDGRSSLPILIFEYLNGLERLMTSLFFFQFCGKTNFNESARGSFGDSLAELDTSVGVGLLFPWIALWGLIGWLSVFCVFSLDTSVGLVVPVFSLNNAVSY